MFGSLQLRDDDPNLVDGAGDAFYGAGTAWRQHRNSQRDAIPRGPVETFGPCAAAALLRRDWFIEAGGFDERYFCYFEDVDLAFRFRLLGGRALQVNDAVVRHGGSVTSGASSDFVLYHATRNQIWTFWKCMPALLLAVALPAHIGLVLLKGVIAWHSGRLAVYANAVRDAIRGMRAILFSRRQIQATRRASVLNIARAITWSPIALLRRAGVKDKQPGS
jgi:GT2 family glycosyltransferase